MVLDCRMCVCVIVDIMGSGLNALELASFLEKQHLSRQHMPREHGARCSFCDEAVRLTVTSFCYMAVFDTSTLSFKLTLFTKISSISTERLFVMKTMVLGKAHIRLIELNIIVYFAWHYLAFYRSDARPFHCRGGNETRYGGKPF